jgi:hypothetical protein
MNALAGNGFFRTASRIQNPSPSVIVLSIPARRVATIVRTSATHKIMKIMKNGCSSSDVTINLNADDPYPEQDLVKIAVMHSRLNVCMVLPSKA